MSGSKSLRDGNSYRRTPSPNFTILMVAFAAILLSFVTFFLGYPDVSPPVLSRLGAAISVVTLTFFIALVHWWISVKTMGPWKVIFDICAENVILGEKKITPRNLVSIGRRLASTWAIPCWLYYTEYQLVLLFWESNLTLTSFLLACIRAIIPAGSLFLIGKLPRIASGKGTT